MGTQDAPEERHCDNCTEERQFPKRTVKTLMDPFYYSDTLGWIYKCPACDSPDPSPLPPDWGDTLTTGP